MIKSTKIYVVTSYWDKDLRAFTSIGAAYDYKNWLSDRSAADAGTSGEDYGILIDVKEMYLEEDS